MIIIIDIETSQYNRVKDGVKSLCINSGTAEPQTPPSFPYLSFVQKDNPIYRKTSDSGGKENHVQPMIQIDAFSTTSMYNAKQIIKLADTVMVGDGWERILLQPTQSVSPFRMTARYQAVVTETSPNNFTVFSN